MSWRNDGKTRTISFFYVPAPTVQHTAARRLQDRRSGGTDGNGFGAQTFRSSFISKNEDH